MISGRSISTVAVSTYLAALEFIKGPFNPCKTVIVPFESRKVKVPFESRKATVQFESRKVTVPFESRKVKAQC